jgi:two-component system, OmpR family, phosphate regulon sensor histidine kinase PhoR
MSLLNTLFIKPNKEEKEPLRLRLSDILGIIREGILIVGENMRIVSFNETAYTTFVRKDEDLTNRRLSEVIRDFTLHEAFEKALKQNISSQLKIEIINKNRRIFDVRVTPIDLVETVQAVGIFYDITQVEHLERVRQEFLSNISHELRTPLTSILAYVETLEDGAIDDEQNNRRFLSVIRKNAERMHLLIDDISELSSIEAGKVKVDIKRVNLHKLVREVFTILDAKAGERDIFLQNDVPEETYVAADYIRLEQMLTNLVDNAVKFNRQEGMVIVEHGENPSHDIIRVIDTGEGIVREHMQRIFERFYRIDRARSREIGGTGLGLAIVKHLARLHGGEVGVSSILGEGSTFYIELPKTEPNETDPV